MNIQSPRGRTGGAPQGFTLIEVLISLVILSVGLLGLGLLQAQSLKASYSSNHRTIATNLAYELLDEIRANHRLAYRYSYISASDFGSISASTCNPAPITAVGGDPVADDISGWECQVVRSLPGSPTATVTMPFNGVSGDIQIQLQWTDQRFQATADQSNNFALQTQL
jgi:type IV pilus assembly protein PilV